MKIPITHAQELLEENNDIFDEKDDFYRSTCSYFGYDLVVHDEGVCPDCDYDRHILAREKERQYAQEHNSLEEYNAIVDNLDYSNIFDFQENWYRKNKIN